MHRRIPLPVVVAILLVIAAALAAYAYFGDTSARQARRMKLGTAFLPALTNAVHSRPQFRRVQVGVGTANAGCFLVVGSVETQEQLAELQSAIAAAKPPLDVMYQVRVLKDSPKGPATQPPGDAKMSQPLPPATNQTPGAAGSGN